MSSDHSYDPRDDDLPSDDSDVPDVLQNLPPLMSISQDLPQLSQDSAPGEVVSLATDLSQIVSDVFLIPTTTKPISSTPKTLRRKFFGSKKRKYKGDLYRQKYPMRCKKIMSTNSPPKQISEVVAENSNTEPVAAASKLDITEISTVASKINLSIPPKVRSSELLSTYSSKTYKENTSYQYFLPSCIRC